eukprot:364828-Chlamydomonas_euryale.AAC.4
MEWPQAVKGMHQTKMAGCKSVWQSQEKSLTRVAERASAVRTWCFSNCDSRSMIHGSATFTATIVKTASAWLPI